MHLTRAKLLLPLRETKTKIKIRTPNKASAESGVLLANALVVLAAPGHMIIPRMFVVPPPAEVGARALLRMAANNLGPNLTLGTEMVVVLALMAPVVALLIVRLHARLALRVAKGNARLS